MTWISIRSRLVMWTWPARRWLASRIWSPPTPEPIVRAFGVRFRDCTIEATIVVPERHGREFALKQIALAARKNPRFHGAIPEVVGIEEFEVSSSYVQFIHGGFSLDDARVPERVQ